MKTAISIPDETFAEAERCAGTLGVSRSEFFARAAQLYLDHVRAGSLTSEIDEALRIVGEDDSNQVAVDAGRQRLAHVDDEW